MTETLGTRELVTLDGLGVCLRGTYHKAYRQAAGSKTVLSERGRVGLLFLNSLSIPRASTGDSAVYWADSFAAVGYPSFRFDLPGLGDTCGVLPKDLLEFINAGGYAAIAAAKVKELVERYGLSGVVIVGHCAGVVTAVCAASSCKECKGLILMDPYFHLTKALRPRVRQLLSDWARRSRWGGGISDLYDRLRVVGQTIRKNPLPRNANFPLLAHWKRVASSGLPILLLKAPGLKSPGIKPRVGEFDYLEHVLALAGRKGRVVVELIEDTDHSFANCVGRAAVQKRAASWLDHHFPRPEFTERVSITSPSNDMKEERNLEEFERCPPVCPN
jgi:pimeloyl-ACP methyl ester carboxylesterase